MGDTTLDDFFAKKDKSKKSKTKKFTSADLSKKIEGEQKGGKKPDYKKEAKNKSDKNHANSEQGDDEWHEVEEEKEKDYTGLKLQQLQMGDNREEDSDGNKQEYDEDGEPIKGNNGQPSAWKPLAGVSGASSASTSSAGQAQAQASQPAPVETPPVPPSEDTPASAKKYVPPSLRNRDAGGATQSSTSGTGRGRPDAWRSKKNAPQIGSESDFPTLGNAALIDTSKPRRSDASKGFEVTKKGVRNSDAQQSGGNSTQLSLGNKYDGLQES